LLFVYGVRIPGGRNGRVNGSVNVRVNAKRIERKEREKGGAEGRTRAEMAIIRPVSAD
jgi:hypothetical protein